MPTREGGDVVIDPAKEQLLPLAKAARLDVLRQTAAWGNPQLLYRWTRKPVRGRVLESRLSGGRICTSAAAIQRFLMTGDTVCAAASAPTAGICDTHRAAELEADRIGLN
jgi:Protein of unknown function (DUF1580)